MIIPGAEVNPYLLARGVDASRATDPIFDFVKTLIKKKKDYKEAEANDVNSLEEFKKNKLGEDYRVMSEEVKKTQQEISSWYKQNKPRSRNTPEFQNKLRELRSNLEEINNGILSSHEDIDKSLEVVNKSPDHKPALAQLIATEILSKHPKERKNVSDQILEGAFDPEAAVHREINSFGEASFDRQDEDELGNITNRRFKYNPGLYNVVDDKITYNPETQKALADRLLANPFYRARLKKEAEAQALANGLNLTNDMIDKSLAGLAEKHVAEAAKFHTPSDVITGTVKKYVPRAAAGSSKAADENELNKKFYSSLLSDPSAALVPYPFNGSKSNPGPSRPEPVLDENGKLTGYNWTQWIPGKFKGRNVEQTEFIPVYDYGTAINFKKRIENATKAKSSSGEVSANAPKRKEISRSELAAKAAAAGYSVADYEKALIKKGIKIIN